MSRLLKVTLTMATSVLVLATLTPSAEAIRHRGSKTGQKQYQDDIQLEPKLRFGRETGAQFGDGGLGGSGSLEGTGQRGGVYGGYFRPGRVGGDRSGGYGASGGRFSGGGQRASGAFEA